MHPDTSHVLILAAIAVLTPAFLLGNRTSASGPPQGSGPPPKYCRTFRMCGVPLDWNAERIRSDSLLYDITLEDSSCLIA